MEIINSLIDFFGLAPDIVTFVDFVIWFVKVLLGTSLVILVMKFMFKATYKIERSLR